MWLVEFAFWSKNRSLAQLPAPGGKTRGFFRKTTSPCSLPEGSKTMETLLNSIRYRG
jgi:hypothetical protein